MPIRNSALDRYVKFVPNRVLKAQELELAEQLQDTKDIYGIGSVYRDGGTVNVKITVTGDTIALGPQDETKPMAIFLNGRFEQLSPQSFNFAGVSAPKIFLNYTLWRVTYNDVGTINDSSLIDAGTSERVAEMGQLEFTLESTDKSVDTTGVAVNATTQFAKNQHTILVYEFTRDTQGAIKLTDSYERVKAPALGRTDNAGPVRVTADPPGLALSPFDPYYLGMDVRLKALEAIHPHKDWAPVIADIYARLDAIKIPPPYVPPPEEPFLRFEPDLLDFTDTPYVAGTSLQKTLSLVNYGEGDGTYDLQNLASNYDFTVIGATQGKIRAHSAITFTVVFAPKQTYPTQVGGAIKVNNDLTCTVIGSTRDAASDPLFAFNTTVLDFGSVSVGDFKMQTLTITNVGSGSGQYELEIGAGDFAVSDDGLNPMSRTLAPGGTATIQVMFRPTSESAQAAAIHFRKHGKNAASLQGVGASRQIGPRYRFLKTSAAFSVKQGIPVVQQVALQNVGDQAGTPTPYLTNATDFALINVTPTVLQPGDILTMQVQATATQSGDLSGVLSVRYNGDNQCQLNASVAASPAPKYSFNVTTKPFGAVATSAGKQTLQVTVTNSGDAPGIPDIIVGQPNQWFNVSYTRSVVTAGGGQVTVNIEFTPTVDMMASGYPSIAASLSFSGYGLNTCAVTASVAGPKFTISPASVDGGIVEFGASGDAEFTLTNEGTANGSVTLSTDDKFQIIGGPTFNLNAGTSATFKVRLAVNDALFAAKYPLAAAQQLYEFVAHVYGAQNSATCSFRGRFKDNRTPRFSPRPNGGTAIMPIQCADVDYTNPQHPWGLFYVYNIGNAPGKPNFTPVSGDLAYFQLARYGADTEIAPGSYGVYYVVSVGNSLVDVTKTARYDVDEGGWQFSVHFMGQPFAVVFCDQNGNQKDDLQIDIDWTGPGSSGNGVIYLKRVNNKLGESWANGGADDENWRINVNVQQQSSLNRSDVSITPVYVSVSADALIYGSGSEYSAHLSAPGCLNNVRIHGTLNEYHESNGGGVPYDDTPGAPTGPAQWMNAAIGDYVYQVFTPDGPMWTADQSLWGQYLDNYVSTGNGTVGTPDTPQTTRWN